MATEPKPYTPEQARIAAQELDEHGVTRWYSDRGEIAETLRVYSETHRALGEALEIRDRLSDDAFRDECAMRAMGTLLELDWSRKVTNRDGEDKASLVCREAFDMADAMVAERARRNA